MEKREGETENQHMTATTRIDVVENLLKRKLEFVDLKPLEKRIDQMASNAELDNFTTKINASVSSFLKRLNGFDENQSKHVEVLLGYDKVLCEKASKAQVDLNKI